MEEFEGSSDGDFRVVVGRKVGPLQTGKVEN